MANIGKDQARRRRAVVASVWVKVTGGGGPHPKAVQLMEDLQQRFPDLEVHLEDSGDYFDRQRLVVTAPSEEATDDLTASVRAVIQEYQGESRPDPIRGLAFRMQAPVDASGEVSEPRAKAALQDIQKKFPKARVEMKPHGGAATVEIYLPDIVDIQKFLAASHEVREIVRRRQRGESEAVQE